MKQRYELNRERVRAELRDQGLKRWWVAEMTCVHKTTLRRWLSGSIRTVQARNVSKLAQVLGIDVEGVASPL